MLYIADWISNGKTTYVANDSLDYVISYVFRNRILKGEETHLVITNHNNRKIAVVFKEIFKDKTKGSKTFYRVYLFGKDKAYEINSDGTIGKEVPVSYSVIIKNRSTTFKDLRTLRSAQQKAYEYLSHSKATHCYFIYAYPYNYVGELVKEGEQYYYKNYKGSVKKYRPDASVDQKTSTPFGL